MKPSTAKAILGLYSVTRFMRSTFEESYGDAHNDDKKLFAGFGTFIAGLASLMIFGLMADTQKWSWTDGQRWEGAGLLMATPSIIVLIYSTVQFFKALVLGVTDYFEKKLKKVAAQPEPMPIEAQLQDDRRGNVSLVEKR